MSDRTGGRQGGQRPTVHIFARAPVPGAVKTRLARGIGDAAACAVYVDLLAQTIDAIAGAADWRTVLAVTPDAATAQDEMWPRALPRVPQGGGDLGARMHRVLSTAQGPAPVIIVGSDIPGLTADHVAAAVAALRCSDLVFGPAVDGGYWLIGASSPPPADLFANVGWSTASALTDTLANTGGLDVARLDSRLEDVDDVESYRRYRDRHPDQP